MKHLLILLILLVLFQIRGLATLPYAITEECEICLSSYSAEQKANIRFQMSLAEDCLQKNQYGKAEESYNQLMVKYAFAPAFYFRGYCCLMKKQHNAAVRNLTLFIMKIKGIPQAYYYRGLAYFNLKEYRNAEADFKLSQDLGKYMLVDTQRKIREESFKEEKTDQEKQMATQSTSVSIDATEKLSSSTSTISQPSSSFSSPSQKEPSSSSSTQKTSKKKTSTKKAGKPALTK